MAGDYSRNTFDPKKHYTRVLKQQGRVDVDADWNENNDLVMHRIVEETRDVVGPAGAPMHDAGFGLEASETGDDLTISKGRIYVDGILCELEEATTYKTQPDYTPPALTNGPHLAYLDVWEAEISALDDPEIREIALGGPDTARRMKTMWQVRLLAGDIECSQGPDALAAAKPKPTGKLAAHTAPLQGDTDPCHLPPTAGYLGMENQLYRIEIQKGGTLPGGGPNDRPTFKWAPDNATLEVAITNVAGKDLEVSEIGKDDLFRFQDTQWVEIVDETSVREGTPNELRRIDVVTPGSRIVRLQNNPPATSGKGLKLRGWKQQAGADQNGIRIDSNAFIGLEYGIEVSFANGTYRAGDYWLVPARTAIHEVLWPGAAEGSPEYLEPRGVNHHYAPLARVQITNGTVTNVTDCRKLFPPLTEKVDFDFYKKHLFGFGVACGLQLSCDGAKKQSVTVKKGYAIDCEGRDMILKANRKVTLTDLPEWERMVDSEAQQVALSMSLGSDGQTIEFHLSEYERENWLAGSALMKAYEDCQQKLVEYLRDNFKPGSSKTDKVGEPEKRLITAWNMLIQLSNPQTGKKVYISPDEHEILEKVYGELAELLKISSTYCSIGALKEFPDYPLKFPQETWFGKGNHRRIRAAHDEARAFVFGDDDRINFFEDSELRFVYTFPDVGGARVLDVAQSRKDGQQIHVLAETKGTSFIATCDLGVEDEEQAWSNPQPIEADERIVQLATGVDAAEVYGLGEEHAIYAIEPASGKATPVASNLNEQPYEAFFVVDVDARRCFVAARDAGDPKGKYNRILDYRIEGAGMRFPFKTRYDLHESGNEGISFSRSGDEELICALITGSTNEKGVVTIRPIQQQQHDIKILGLDTTSAVSIAGVSGGEAPLAAVAVAETNDVRFVAFARKHDDLTMPAQICPTGVASNRLKELYVVNHRSHTVSFTKKPATKFDFAKLAEYRADVLNAYRDLIILMLESLKDCLCEHLMPDCPVCGEDDVVYLGVLELDDDFTVRRICPLEKRTWVLSPRNVGYWLSMVPVLPAIRWVVERLCCIDIPKILEDKFEVPPTHDDQWKCADMPAFDEITWDRIKEPFEGAKETLKKKAPALVEFFTPKEQKKAAQPKMNELVGQPVDVAVATLAEANIQVLDVAQVTGGRRGLVDMLRPFSGFSEGRPVTLIERNGKVVNAVHRVSAREINAIAEKAAHALEVAEETKSRVADTSDLTGGVEEMRRRVAEAEQRAAEALAAARLDLRKEVGEDVERLRQRVDESRTIIEERDAMIRTLTENVETLQEQLGAARKSQKETAERIDALAARAASVDELKTMVERISRRLPPVG